MTTNKKNIAILSFAMIVAMLGFGMVIPIFPFYVERMGASGDDLGFLIATAALTQLLFSPVWGGVSDRIGRRPVLIIGMAGSSLTLLMFGLSTQLWMLYVARALSGILSSATFPSAMAYISDSTAEQDRGGGIGIVSAAAWLGLIIGPGVGGWLAGDSISRPFFIGAGLSLVATLLLFLIPESLSSEARRPPAGKARASLPIGDTWHAVRRIVGSPAGVLLFMAFLLGFGLTGFQGIFGMFALKKFNYGPQQIGVLLTAIGIVATLAQAGLTGPLTRRWGEAMLIKACLLASAIGFVSLVLANSYTALLITTGFFELSKTLLRPAVAALTSKQLTIGHGTAMGLNNAFMSLGQIVGPIWSGYMLDVNVDYPFLSSAVLVFAGFLISLVWVSQDRKLNLL